MNENDIRGRVLEMLARIAPEADLTTVRPDRNLRDQLDVDSMDLLNLAIAVDRELGIDIPESDYARLTTIDGFVKYLTERSAAAR